MQENRNNQPIPYLIAGFHRLPRAYRQGLEALPGLTPVEAGLCVSDPRAVILVAVSDTAGEEELSAMVRTHPDRAVVALYTGMRPSVAARCILAGASEAVALSELSPEALTARLAEAAPEARMHASGPAAGNLPAPNREPLVQHAQALSRANLELSRLDKAKSEFIALAAHEIRTPLTAIKTATYLLKRELSGTGPGPEGDGNADRLMEIADRNIQRLTTLAEDLLDYTKFETRQAALTFSAIDPAACAAAAAGGLIVEAADAGVRLAVSLPERLPTLQADEKRLHQVIANLIDNAIKRTPRGGEVRLRAEALTHWREVTLADGRLEAPGLPEAPDGWVEITVEDTGPPVPEELAARMFDSFSPGQGTLTRDCAEFGLALALCRRIAETHGGRVWAEPAEPGGIRLVLRLPRVTASCARLLRLSDQFTRLQGQRVASRLLILEAGDEDRRCAAKKAVGMIGRPGWMFVELPEPGQVVGILAGDEAAVTDTLQKMAHTGDSSLPDRGPIKGGWALAGPEEPFHTVLMRARAALRPL